MENWSQLWISKWEIISSFTISFTISSTISFTIYEIGSWFVWFGRTCFRFLNKSKRWERMRWQIVRQIWDGRFELIWYLLLKLLSFLLGFSYRSGEKIMMKRMMVDDLSQFTILSHYLSHNLPSHHSHLATLRGKTISPLYQLIIWDMMRYLPSHNLPSLTISHLPSHQPSTNSYLKSSIVNAPTTFSILWVREKRDIISYTIYHLILPSHLTISSYQLTIFF